MGNARAFLKDLERLCFRHGAGLFVQDYVVSLWFNGKEAGIFAQEEGGDGANFVFTPADDDEPADLTT